ncbi:hypothetical protein L682_11890 [Aquipseudomonas alcaligenes OT 69]|nr:hypothetical protein L682_11890 [Pseudomonas alcaligenes OT 69]
MNLRSPVLVFPSLQHFIVAAFGFYNLASFFVFVNFELALTAVSSSGRNRCCSKRAGLRIEQSNDSLQAKSIFSHQFAKLLLKLNLSLKSIVIFQLI